MSIAPTVDPQDNVINYDLAPTLEEFLDDRGIFSGIRGPVGSGKSSICCIKILQLGAEQEPWRGVRKTRWAIIRNSYPELKSTTIKTWNDWFGRITTMRYDSPITGTVTVNLTDGTKMEIELLFVSMDKPDDVKKMLSLEVTGVWLNEARELPKSVLDAVSMRHGRYPSMRHGGPSWSGIIADTNAPDDDEDSENWWYWLSERETPDGWKFYSQPGALLHRVDGQYEPNPGAENIGNLKGGYQYYLNMLAGKDPDWIKVYVLNQYGSTFAGKPVYRNYWRDGLHVSKVTLKAFESLPLRLSFDFGLTPACCVYQISPRGQLRILAEFIGEDQGIRDFASNVVKPGIANQFPKCRSLHITGDPAGAQRSQADEKTCFQELRAIFGVKPKPAPSNELQMRLNAVMAYLQKMIDGEPGFIIDPSCRVIRKGFNGGYHYKKVSLGGQFKVTPEKNMFSHIHDSIGYCASDSDEGYMQGDTRRKKEGVKTTGGWGGAV